MTLLDAARPGKGSQTGDAASSPQVTVLTDRCAGCQECVIRCPAGALSMDTGNWVALADAELCVGCRQCVRTCPFSAIVVEGPLLVTERTAAEAKHEESLLGEFGEVRQGFASWDEALAEAERCLSCPDPTCVRGCPAHNDIPGFIAALRERDLEGAHRVLSRSTVLSDVCARVCNQAAQCEGACTWSLAGGQPVAIGRLERFIADHSPAPAPERGAPIDLSVGIVGAGPAAIGAAWTLVEAGASVTVYEQDATPGGLLDWGIPEFSLPEKVASRPWHQLTEAGVDLRCGHEVSPEEVDGLLSENDAVVLANGASQPLRLPVPGAELGGVVDATRFLKGAKQALTGEAGVASFLAELGIEAPVSAPGTSARVLVLGAGNTAMDVARTARRLGLDALCVDWLDERFALARPDELDEARKEGVEIRFLRTLTGLEGEGARVRRARLATTTQPRADRRPKVLRGAVEVVDVCLVVMAMGYRVDPGFAGALPGTPLRREAVGLADRRWTASGILAGPASEFAFRNPVGRLALGREVGLWGAAFAVKDRTWVVGDALVGPSTVVEAMAQGRRAAVSILSGRPKRPGRERPSGTLRVLVCHESQGGKTARAADEVGSALSRYGHQVRVLPLARVGQPELAAADLVVVGSWVEGLVLAGVRPAKATRAWLDGLPRLGGVAVAVFCTFAVAPKGALEEMRRGLESKGATVVAQAAFGPRELRAKSGLFGPGAFGYEIAQGLRRLEGALVE